MKPIENKIYASIIKFCEDLEDKKVGNGHHVAQKLTTLISEGLLPQQQKRILDQLSSIPKTTKEIADKLKMKTKAVSAQLLQIQKKTLLVYSKNKGKNKLWYR